MKLYLPLVIAIINYAAGEEAENFFYRSDYTYVPAFNGWFKFHRGPLPWNLARRRCENEGSKLATPMNKDYKMLFRDLITGNNISAMYTGAHTIFSHGEFYTVEGISYMEVSQDMWRRDGLTYSEHDRCAVIDERGLLASVSCEDDHPFLCFKKFARLNTTECGTTDPEYVFEKSTGSCYKLHRTRKDWRTAFEVCSAEGGYLAIPFDADEAQLLADLSAGDSYIGFFNWAKKDEDEEWHTVHGEPITYTHWEHPAGFWYKCGAIQKNTAHLRATLCLNKEPFICEKDPKSLTIIPKNDPIE